MKYKRNKNRKQCTIYRRLRAELMLSILGAVITVTDDANTLAAPDISHYELSDRLPEAVLEMRPSVTNQTSRVSWEREKLSHFYAGDRMLAGVADMLLRG